MDHTVLPAINTMPAFTSYHVTYKLITLTYIIKRSGLPSYLYELLQDL